ncbi:MAG: hypothetical protein ACR2OI_07960 [Acidimicrobiia bacterium]
MSEPSKILLDSPSDLDPTPVISFLARLDHPVEVCHGPGDETPCPLLVGKGCEKVSTAHGIIYHLDLDRPAHRDILREYRRQVPSDVPLRVVVQPGQDRTYAELLRGLPVWTHDPSPAELDGFAAMVEAADYMRGENSVLWGQNPE